MTDGERESPASDPEPREWDAGGLHFAVSFRVPAGATFRMFGPVAGGRKELVRFDDFVDSPHYHAPADGDPILFDRAALGEPLEWLVRQVSDHLEEFLTSAGFAAVLPEVDTAAAAGSAEQIRAAMIDCVPDGYFRVAGVGLQRNGSAAGREAAH
jgi:hypothetical protein